MSQCDQLAALLSDGEWHTTRELLREVPSIIHSRISDLRKRGYVIEHETVGVGAAGSRYRLVQIGAGPVADRAAVAVGHPLARSANGAVRSAASLGTENVSPAPTTRPRLSSQVLPAAGCSPQLTLTDAA